MADTVTDDQMAPDASPGEVSRKSGVRRVNNLPVYIVGGVMAAFLLIMVLVAMDRADRSQTATSAGKDKGKMILTNIWNSVAPSTRAFSIISRGRPTM